MSKLSDTSRDAERALRQSLRRMSPARKWQQMGAIARTARLLHAAGVRSRFPTASEAFVAREWQREALGELARLLREPAMNSAEDLRVVREVMGVLERLGIPAALGGSWASSLLGKMRFTFDADITVEPFADRAKEFTTAFGEDYYVNLAAVEEANRLRTSFNLIHTPSSFKVDIFVRKDRPFDEIMMTRRRRHIVGVEPEQSLFLLTAEDIVLLKLEWYRLGQEVSERQWNDVLGVLQVQENLDDAYLDHWAEQLGVSDLLGRARKESEL